MTFEEFRDSLRHKAAEWTEPRYGGTPWVSGPKPTNRYIKTMVPLVLAYLHRKEVDASNAAYWYQRAGKAASENR